MTTDKCVFLIKQLYKMNKLIQKIEETVLSKRMLEEKQQKKPYSFRDGGFGGHSEYWDSNYWDDQYSDASGYADSDNN